MKGHFFLCEWRCTDPTRETGNRKWRSESDRWGDELIAKKNIHLPRQKLTCSSWRSLPVGEEVFELFYRSRRRGDGCLCAFFIMFFFPFVVNDLTPPHQVLPVSAFSLISICVFTSCFVLLDLLVLLGFDVCESLIESIFPSI